MKTAAVSHFLQKVLLSNNNIYLHRRNSELKIVRLLHYSFLSISKIPGNIQEKRDFTLTLSGNVHSICIARVITLLR